MPLGRYGSTLVPGSASRYGAYKAQVCLPLAGCPRSTYPRGSYSIGIYELPLLARLLDSRPTLRVEMRQLLEFEFHNGDDVAVSIYHVGG